MKDKFYLAAAGFFLMTNVYGTMISHKCLDPEEVYGRTTTIHYGSAVEPTITVNPRNKNNIIAAWQKGRISNGAALESRIAYTHDGGETWHKTKVPFQICKGGITQRSGDDWLFYAADGSRVYLCTAFLNATKVSDTKDQSGVAVSISEDGGASWSNPRILFSSKRYISEPTQRFANSDKTSITADTVDPNRAIAVWSNFDPGNSFHGNTEGSYTLDGGKTWSEVQLIYNPFPDLVKQGLSNDIENDNSTGNNVIVMVPGKCRCRSGDWLNFAVRAYARPDATNEQYTNDSFPFKYTLNDIVVVRSTDRGMRWQPNSTIVIPSYVNNLTFTGGYTYDDQGNITGGVGTQMRNDQTVPSYNVNPLSGNLYVAYQTSEFRSDQLPQIGLTTSRDGGRTWSPGVKVSLTPENSKNPQAFGPFVAVAERGGVGILYFDFRHDDKTDPNRTPMDAWLAIYQEVFDPNGGSTGIGLEFVKEIRLSKQSYIAQNGPTTTQGVMTDGDYQFIATHGNNFYAIYTKSFDGPFTEPTVFFEDQEHQAVVLLDDNRRTAPYLSIVKNDNDGAELVSTQRLK